MTIEDRTLKSRTHTDGGEAKGKSKPAMPLKTERRSQGIGGWLKRNRRLSLISGAVLVGAAVVLFLGPKLLGNGAHKYITAQVTRGDIENTVTAVGSVQPKNYVDVGAQVSGQIKTLNVDIGSKVKKGDLLAEIDAQVQTAKVESDKDNLASLQAQLVNQQAQLVLKKAQYERQVRLDKDNATSKDDLETAKAAYNSQTAQIDAIQAQIKQAQSQLQADQVTLGYATIVAPMDGTVVSLSARLGQTLVSIQQAPTILRIADLSVMQIQTQVSEADVSKLKIGMPAYFTMLGNPNRRYNSAAQQIWPTPETVNNVILYDVLSDVDNSDGSLMTQMTAQGFFITASAKNVLLVPVSAVQPLTGRGGKHNGAGGSRTGGANGFGASGNGQRTGTQGGGNFGFQRSASGATNGGAPGAGTGQHGGGRAAFVASHGIVEVMGPGGKIERRMVETGVTDRVNVEIKSGLKEGETVIVGEEQKKPKTATPSTTGARPGGGRPFMMAP